MMRRRVARVDEVVGEDVEEEPWELARSNRTIASLGKKNFKRRGILQHATAKPIE